MMSKLMSQMTEEQREDRRKLRHKYQERYREKLRRETFAHYSSGTMTCARCDFSNIRALTIDHIDGSGHVHRREGQPSGYRFYTLLRQRGFPSGYQVLCANCQFIKQVEEVERRNQ